jgi:uncharacterized protein (TIGR02145 family)
MKKMKFIFALTVVLASAAMLFTSCNQLNNEINNLDQKNTNTNTNQSGYVDQGIKFNPSKTYDTMTDNDGNVYKTITIGTQTWMAENLRSTYFRNGDAITSENSCAIWQVDTTGLQCIYNDAATPGKWGRLYNWYAANDPRNIAPKGWHIPSISEWKTLLDYASKNCTKPGSDNSAAKYLCATDEWSAALKTDNGSGFTILPAGVKLPEVPTNLQIIQNYSNRGTLAVFWTNNTNMDTGSSSPFFIGDNTTKGSVGMSTMTDAVDLKTVGYSIRLIKD